MTSLNCNKARSNRWTSSNHTFWIISQHVLLSHQPCLFCNLWHLQEHYSYTTLTKLHSSWPTGNLLTWMILSTEQQIHSFTVYLFLIYFGHAKHNQTISSFALTLFNARMRVRGLVTVGYLHLMPYRNWIMVITQM
jgi:hypothetical protein